MHDAYRTSHGPCMVQCAWCMVHVRGERCMVDGALSDLEGSASTCAADREVGLRRVSGDRWHYPLPRLRSQVSGPRSQAQGNEPAAPSLSRLPSATCHLPPATTHQPLLTSPGAPELPSSRAPEHPVSAIATSRPSSPSHVTSSVGVPPDSWSPDPAPRMNLTA